MKRIAIIIHGGIGNGPFSQGVPMLHNIVSGLSSHFEIVVYSALPPNSDFHSDKFQLSTPATQIKSIWWRWFKLCRLIIEDHRKKRFDIVFAFWGYPAGLLAVVLSKIILRPSVIYLQGGDIAGIAKINYGTFHKPMSRMLARWAYERTNLLLVMSQYQRDALTNYKIKKQPVVIPWGPDLQMFRFIGKKHRDELNVIHVGHLAAVKDQTTLIKAFAEIVKVIPAKLRMFGADAGMKRELQDLVRRSGLETIVQFNDVAKYDLMPQHYEWADVMLHTSLSEGQCMALTEAAATGVLMAGTNVAPLYDLGEKCGVIVDRGDHVSLSKAVIDLHSRPDLWQMKLINARSWIEQHPLLWSVSEIKKQLDGL